MGLFKPWRPKKFVLTGCMNLTVRDITFGDAPLWGLHMLGCEKVLVESVTVKSRPDVPARVAIAEYVDVAGAFFGREESGMINAVLDALARERRPAEFAARD